MREEQLFLRRLAKRALNRDLNKGWHGWLAYLDDCEEGARQLRVMDAVVKRFLNKGISMALNQWTMLWRERQRVTKLMRRASSPLARAWRQWREVADQKAWLKGVAARFNGGLSRAWNRWLEMIDERAQMARFLKRGLNSGMAHGFSAWCDLVYQAQREKRMLGKFGKRLLKASEMRSFNQWCAS